MRPKLLPLAILLMAFSLQAQYYEAGIYTGVANYTGELSEFKFSSKGYGLMIGIFGRYNATKYLSVKGSLTKGSIKGSDEFSKSETIRMRNLSFRSDVLELGLTGEVNFSPYNIRANQTGVPYFFAGFALAHFNPQAEMRGAWYDLQPQKTEGKKYSRYSMAVPFGLGMKFNLSYKINFGLEIGARKTFSDYFDDVSSEYADVLHMRQSSPTAASLAYRTPEVTGQFGENPVGTQRGDPTNKDWYFFGGLTVSVNLTDKYGLDFDKKFETFKEHLKKPKMERKEKRLERKQNKLNKSKDKSKFRLFKKKNMLEPQAKKRTH